MVTIPAAEFAVILFVVLMLVVGLLLYGIAVTFEAVEAHRDADGQRRKVRRQSKQSYRSPGTGEYEETLAAETGRRWPPIGGVQHG